MKVLLVTLWGNVNIGNRLQHYALQTTLEKLGFEVDNAVYNRQREPLFLTMIKTSVKSFLYTLGINKFADFDYKKIQLDKKRQKRFDEFINKTVQNPVLYDFDVVDNDFDKTVFDKYKFVITGSDQVWHHWFPNEKFELPYFYLSFVEKEKRISYAASFGFSSFPNEDLEDHKIGLEGIDRLSVRELEMVDMIKSLVGKEAEIVVDPTMLLSKNEWNSISAKKMSNITGKYVISYFIGNKDDEYLEAIQTITNRIKTKLKEDIKIINLFDIKAPEYYSVSPDEFLFLVNNAEFIFTDSFHGTVFSIIYEKNFLVFKRKQYGSNDMFGRLSGLLKQMAIDDHEFKPGMNDVPGAPDYDDVCHRMNLLSKKSFEWLKESMR